MKNTFSKNQHGFTLIEILVATAIFVTVVAAMLILFNLTLRINRRVQGLRELVQSSRTFTETLTREIRNGRIDYSNWASECPAKLYGEIINRSLALQNRAGDKLCFYLDEQGSLFLHKHTPSGDITEAIFIADKFRIDPSTFNLVVRPQADPKPQSGIGNPGIQPFVTILARFELLGKAGRDASTLNYQTTVSTDVYDIPAKN